MAKKATITSVGSGYMSTDTINSNFTALNNAFDNTLSRDGSTPNTMSADIDLNSNDLLNVATANVGTLKINGAVVSAFETGIKVFETRADAIAGNTGSDQFILVAGLLYEYDASGTALTTGDSRTWKPSGDVYLEHFGASGDGTTDDTASVQAASNWIESLGGGEVYGGLGKSYLIDGNLSLGNSVKLVGPHREGFGSVGPSTDTPYENVTGSLVINSLATITGDDNSGLVGWFIRRKGMTYPTVDDSAFAGTVLTAGGNDVRMSKNMIMGFNYAFYSDGHERAHITENNLDNLNGIYIDNCTDVPYLMDNHAWPFSTIEAVALGTSTWQELTRSGTAYKIVGADWAVMARCFSYGYFRGIDCSANTVRITDCGTDGTGIATPFTNSIGILASGNRLILKGNVAAGQDASGIYIGGSGGYLDLTNNEVHGIVSHGIQIDGSHDVSIANNLIDNVASGITVASTFTGRLVDGGGNIFQNVSGSDWNIGATTDLSSVLINDFLTDRAAGGAPLGGSGSLVADTVASAATTALPLAGEAFYISGTTNFGSLTGYWPGRVVTLEFAAALTVFNGTSGANNMRLSDGNNFTTQAGDTLTLKHFGDQWYEIGRSRQHYRDDNILGTVSQSGGVPTGAIIESGSNGNGYYVRYADGTQICTNVITSSATVPVTWTFPIAFSAAPVVTNNGRGTTATISNSQTPSTTGVDVNAWDTAGARVATSVDVMAVGKWF